MTLTTNPPALLDGPLTVTFSGEALAMLNKCRQAQHAFATEDAFDQPCRADRLRWEYEDAQRQLAEAVCAAVGSILDED